MAHIPAVVNQHLDSIDIRNDGGLLLAASSLTNRYWTGSIWYYSNAEEAPDVEKCAAGVETDTGVSDAHWLPGSDKVVCGCDSGSVQLWRLQPEQQAFALDCEISEHDGHITSISVNCSSTRMTSSSQDRVIKIWDLQEGELVTVQSYKGHSDTVWCATWHPTKPDIFASSSQDGKLLLWDTRKPKPASLMDTEFLPSLPKCVAWRPESEFTIAVGTETGHILMQDVRLGVGTPCMVRPHQRGIHRLAFAPHNQDWLASVADDCYVAVTEWNDPSASVIWRDTRSHTDFVRGLAWHPQSHKLYTSAWDFQVVGRTVSPETSSDIEDSMAMDTLSPRINGHDPVVAMQAVTVT